MKYVTPTVKKEAFVASSERIKEEYKNPIVKPKGSETNPHTSPLRPID